MNRTEEHALTLVRANEDVDGFGIGPLLYALRRVHDSKDAQRAVTRLLSNNTITNFGGRLFLTEDDDDE